MKIKYNNLFKYAGNKAFIIEIVNNLIQKTIGQSFTTYYEPFIGSGAIFYNLENKFIGKFLPILNDFDYNIFLMHKAVQKYDYQTYLACVKYIEETFGDIKAGKENYYNFRNWFNENFYQKIKDKNVSPLAGLFLIYLSSACINSMLRFGPNGMNQSFGNRKYIIPEELYTNIAKRLKNAEVQHGDWLNCFPSNLVFNDSILFLDPPYVDRNLPYGKGFNQNKFLDILKNSTLNNSLMMYTDIENDRSDTLLSFGWNKYVLRTMINISPNRKEGVETTGNEILYWKYES
jgi:DNA adenine methylase